MIILAMHGILTGRTMATWPELFQVFVDRGTRNVRVICDQYDAGPFPRLNWFRGNPRMARGMAKRLAAWLVDSETERLALVGHSNGCDIIRRTALLLAEKGIAVEAIVMVAPPVDPDLEANGLQKLIDDGMLGRVVCYCTPGDYVMAQRFQWGNPLTWVGGAFRWPYGNAGRVGFKGVPDVFDDTVAPRYTRAFNRWFPNFGHTSYFKPENRRRIFQLMLADCQLPDPNPTSNPLKK